MRGMETSRETSANTCPSPFSIWTLCLSLLHRFVCKRSVGIVTMCQWPCEYIQCIQYSQYEYNCLCNIYDFAEKGIHSHKSINQLLLARHVRIVFLMTLTHSFFTSFSCQLVSVLPTWFARVSLSLTTVLLFVLCCIVLLVCLDCVMFMKYMNEEHDTKGCIHLGFTVN